jgi:transposase-like protein
VAAEFRAIFNAPDRDQAESQMPKMAEKLAQKASKLVDWLESNIPEELAAFSFPVNHPLVDSLGRVCLEI